jgi:hypothetical protein
MTTLLWGTPVRSTLRATIPTATLSSSPKVTLHPSSSSSSSRLRVTPTHLNSTVSHSSMVQLPPLHLMLLQLVGWHRQRQQ